MVQFTDDELRIVFFRTANGREPVREWLRKLSDEDRSRLGEDLKTVQRGWPIGMPLVRSLGMVCGKFVAEYGTGSPG